MCHSVSLIPHLAPLFPYSFAFHFLRPSTTLPGQTGQQLGESQRGTPHPEVPVPSTARGAAGWSEGLRAGLNHWPAAMSALEPGGGLHTAG